MIPCQPGFLSLCRRIQVSFLLDSPSPNGSSIWLVVRQTGFSKGPATFFGNHHHTGKPIVGNQAGWINEVDLYLEIYPWNQY